MYTLQRAHSPSKDVLHPRGGAYEQMRQGYPTSLLDSRRTIYNVQPECQMHALRNLFTRHTGRCATSLRGHRECLAAGVQEDGEGGKFDLRATSRRQGRRAGLEIAIRRITAQSGFGEEGVELVLSGNAGGDHEDPRRRSDGARTAVRDEGEDGPRAAAFPR